MKGYFKSNPFAAMTLHEEDGGSSSASISPHMEEDPVLSFHTSQSSCYIPPTHPSMHGYINEYSYYPSASQNCPTEDPSSMYGSSPLEGHPFFSPNTVFSATPSPNDYTGHRCNTMPLYLGYPHMTNGAPSESSGSDFEPEKTKHVTDPVATYHCRHSSADDEEEETEIKRTKKPSCMKRQVREKSKKRCSNCHASNSPSWRRSVSKHSKGDLLCNACGLYEKTAKKKRMLVTHDDGSVKVVRKRDARNYTCFSCGAHESTLWRKHNDDVQCERCARRPHKV